MSDNQNTIDTLQYLTSSSITSMNLQPEMANRISSLYQQAYVQLGCPSLEQFERIITDHVAMWRPINHQRLSRLQREVDAIKHKLENVQQKVEAISLKFTQVDIKMDKICNMLEERKPMEARINPLIQNVPNAQGNARLLNNQVEKKSEESLGSLPGQSKHEEKQKKRFPIFSPPCESASQIHEKILQFDFMQDSANFQGKIKRKQRTKEERENEGRLLQQNPRPYPDDFGTKNQITEQFKAEGDAEDQILRDDE